MSAHVMDIPQDLFSYPQGVGWKRSDTSREAAVSINAASLRAGVLRVLMERPLTADECADAMHCPILSIRPRLSELRRLGNIEDSGERRRNESGKRAIVWRIR